MARRSGAREPQLEPTAPSERHEESGAPPWSGKGLGAIVQRGVCFGHERLEKQLTPHWASCDCVRFARKFVPAWR